MALKPDCKSWTICEQIVEDPASGLTLQFEITSEGLPQLRVFGAALPFGNREILFDKNGAEAAAGTFTGDLCRPAWLGPIDS